MSAKDELAMFFKAGKDREVPLDVLFAMTAQEVKQKIQKRLLFNGTMARLGMYVPSEIDEIAVRVAAYMGWIDDPALITKE